MKNSCSFTRCLACAAMVLLAAPAPADVTPTNRVAETTSTGSTPASKPDTWKSLRAFLGRWVGDASGQSGTGKSDREYKFVLNDRFLHASNKTTYPPQPKNQKGEVHEDTGFFSYDRALKKLVLRQFHGEGFVNHYLCQSVSEDQRTFVFVSATIENIPAGWRARETYKFSGDDEFVETFELAEPGKEFKLYSEAKFRRNK